jgi:hypothetical protein
VQDDEPAFLERHQRRHIEAADMEDRGGRQGHVVGEAIERMHAIGVVPPEIAMGQHRALGAAGGAGGVHDHCNIILADTDGFGRRRERLRPMHLVLGGEEGLDRFEPLPLRLNDRADLRVDDQGACRAILDHEGKLRAGQAEIERHENRAEPSCGKHHEKEHRLVEAKESDALALADAERREPRRASLDRRLHVGVSPRAPFEMQGLALRRAQGALAEPVGQANVRGH